MGIALGSTGIATRTGILSGSSLETRNESADLVRPHLEATHGQTCLMLGGKW
jgi:hypothetical protein